MKARYILGLYCAAFIAGIDTPQLRAEISELAEKVANDHKAQREAWQLMRQADPAFTAQLDREGVKFRIQSAKELQRAFDAINSDPKATRFHIEEAKIPLDKPLVEKCITLGDSGGMSNMKPHLVEIQHKKLIGYTNKKLFRKGTDAGDTCLQEVITHIFRHNPTDYNVEAACDTAMDMGLAAPECANVVVWGK
jgi:hypothetical protein